MKAFLVSLVFITTTPIMASTYSCISSAHESGILKISSPNSVTWENDSRSEFSTAKFHHVDQAPFSPLNGQMQFLLLDFYNTEDSGFYLSLPLNAFKLPPKMNITLYFDNDDHAEDEINYLCIRQ